MVEAKTESQWREEGFTDEEIRAYSAIGLVLADPDPVLVGPLKLFYISQQTNNGYDTYDGAIVCAENEDEARRISPIEALTWIEDKDSWAWHLNDEYHLTNHSCWAKATDVEVEYIGEAKEGLEKGVVLASFNAG